MQDTAIKITIDNLSDIRSEKAILPLKAFLVDLFKYLEIYPVKCRFAAPCGGFSRVNLQRIYNMLNTKDCEAGK
jgi:hypothetical protein